MTDERRIQACLAACEGLTTEALEAGLVHDVFEEFALLQTALALAADIAEQGNNPAHYIRFDRVVAHTRAVAARLEAAGGEAFVVRHDTSDAAAYALRPVPRKE